MRNVMDYGAFADGIHKDTAAIQKAIDAGGMVQFPPGVYLAGSLYLKSNGGLYLEPGAVLMASPDREDYNADDFCVQNVAFSTEHVSGAHFIIAVEQQNITICGGGRIDGNRQAFFGDKTAPDCEKHPGKFPWNPEEPENFAIIAAVMTMRNMKPRTSSSVSLSPSISASSSAVVRSSVGVLRRSSTIAW